ncbi:MAG: hypothetical protein D3904_18230 [Candidatus Electrothrix sp. EH2]|nr:hypothetical protein [Candidatus Electrothrix sp. EH2]
MIGHHADAFALPFQSGDHLHGFGQMKHNGLVTEILDVACHDLSFAYIIKSQLSSRGFLLTTCSGRTKFSGLPNSS